MRSRSFIFIFNLLFVGGFLAGFALPLLLVDGFLVQYSGQWQQIRMVKNSIHFGKQKPILLLGDSTVRNLETFEGLSAFNYRTVNAGSGGSVAMEWVYSLKLAFRANPGFKKIFVGMSNGENLMSSGELYSYYPFLLGVRDVYTEYQQKNLNTENALRLLEHIFFNSIFAKEDILRHLVGKFFPEMQTFMTELAMEQVKDSGLHSNRIYPLTRDQLFRGARELRDLALQKGVPLHFALSPVASATRNTAVFRAGAARFREVCEFLNLHCTDLSNKLEDKHFTSDAVHLLPKSMSLYQDMIDDLLRKGE